MNDKNLHPVDGLFKQAVERVAAGDSRKALATLFRLFSLDPAHVEGLSAASRLMSLLRDDRGAELMKAVSLNPENPHALYDLGYHLINMGRPDAARPFLETCLRHAGEVPEVLYELGYCHYRDRSFGRAADTLGKAAELLDPRRASTANLLRIECLLYAGREAEGKPLLKEAEEDPGDADQAETLRALHLMFARYRKAGTRKPLDLRTWHFIQHGGVMLAQSDKEGSRGHYQRLAMNAVAVGAVLRLLQAVLEGLGIRPDALLHLDGGHSYTLSLALGSLLSRPVRSFTERSGENELLVLPDPETAYQAGIQPVDREDCTYLFCFRVFPMQEYSFLPEFIGLMAYHFRFPWQERVEIIADGAEGRSALRRPVDERSAEAIAGEIADAARLLPEDAHAARLVAFYRRHRDMLICSSLECFPKRRIFNPLTPA